MNDAFEEARSKMPAGLRRSILVESGHRCAIPTCRHIEVEIHHIVPWSQCKVHEYDNLIALCPNCHRRADRGEIDRKSLQLYKVNLRYAHDKFSQLEMDVLFELRRAGFRKGLLWPSFNLIMLKRLQDAKYIRIQQPQGYARIMGMETTPVTLHLTNEGDKFLQDLGKSEL